MRYVAGFVLFFGLGAAVQAQEISGVYAGLSLGSLSYEENGEKLGLPISERASAYRVVGGYQFNSVYALEAGWGRSGDIEEQFRGVDSTGTSASLDFTAEYEIATLRFLAIAPFGSLSMFGGAGYYDSTVEASVRFESTDEVITASAEDSDDGLTVVGGVQYEFNRIALRGEYEWFDTDDADVESFNITALFRF